MESADEFLSKGKSRKIQQTLSAQMEEASEELDFEKAAIIRDKIKSLNIIQSSLTISETFETCYSWYKSLEKLAFKSKQNWEIKLSKTNLTKNLNEILNSFLFLNFMNKAVYKISQREK